MLVCNRKGLYFRLMNECNQNDITENVQRTLIAGYMDMLFKNNRKL